MQAMKLFKVEQDKLATQFFYAKKAAKKFRDKLIEEGVSAIVQRGPDHWKGES